MSDPILIQIDDEVREATDEEREVLLELQANSRPLTAEQ